MKPIIEKSAIYNICLNHINTVNSFVDDDGNNSFETMVGEIEEYVSHQRQEILDQVEREVIGEDEKLVGDEVRNRYRRLFENDERMARNQLRAEQRQKLSTLREKEGEWKCLRIGDKASLSSIFLNG